MSKPGERSGTSEDSAAGGQAKPARPELPLVIVKRGSPVAKAGRFGMAGQVLHKIRWLPLIPVIMLTGGVIAMYFQPPGIRVAMHALVLQPGGGTKDPIAVPAPKAPVATSAPSARQVVALAKLVPEGELRTVAPPVGAGDARIAVLKVEEGSKVDAGAVLGPLRPGIAGDLGTGTIDVVAPGTHDTASAVAGTPLGQGWAYISSGTWSLVGVELDAPVLTEAAAQAGLTNEAGVFGRVRLLTNVMGLWLLESCRREWEAEGRPQELAGLLDAAARRTQPAGVIFPDDHRFFAPPSMVRAIRGMLTESGQADTDDPVLITKVILDSLALRYATVVSAIERLTGHPIPGIHIVGGGSRNAYLNQATADASGREVLAGPVEATAIGNLLVQGIAAGTVASLGDGRRMVAEAFPPSRFEPRDTERWEQPARLFRDISPRQ